MPHPPHGRDAHATQPTPSAPLLLIDTASTRVQLALFLPDHPTPLYESRTDEAGLALFSCAQKLLARATLTISDIATFAYCDGPGSILGIRTAAAALRTWRATTTASPRKSPPADAPAPGSAGILPANPAPRPPIYSYHSLTLLAHHLLATENAPPRNLSLIADARRDTWHHITIDTTGALSPLHRIPTAQLLATPNTLAMPSHFRHWTPLPPNLRIIPYTLETILTSPAPALAAAPLFTPAPAPDAFLHEDPTYQTWTPQIHQAP